MACCCYFLSALIGNVILIGYPGYKVLSLAKEGKFEKIWIIYFLILGSLFLLENTLLFQIIFILGKICKKIYPTLKLLFALWSYYPEYRGALLLDQQFGKYIDLAYLKINPIAGKILSKLGIPNRENRDFREKKEYSESGDSKRKIE